MGRRGTDDAEEDEHGRITRAELLLLVATVVVALVVRLAGIDFLLPANTESDGSVIVGQVALIEGEVEEPWLQDVWSYYPHLVARAVTLATARPESAGSLGAGATLAEHLEAASAPHVRVRRVVAWLSILVVPGTWWLARRFAGRRAALLAAALVALSPLAVASAQEARPHAPAAALALVAVAAAVHARSRPTLASWIVAGVAAGLALGALQSGVAVLLALLVAWWTRERASRPRPLVAGLAALALVALFVLVLWPLRGTRVPGGGDGRAMWVREDGNVQFFGHTVFVAMFDGKGFATVLRVLVAFEPMLLAACGAALVLWLARERRFSPDLRVVLAYVVPYLVAIGLYERTYERFVVQLVPYLACAAAWLAARVAADGKRALAGAVALALVAVPAAADLVLARARVGPDTSDLAARWIAEHARSERVAIVPPVDVPLARSDAALDDAERIGQRSPWLGYQLARRAELGPRELVERFDLRTLPMGRKKVRDQVLADPLAYLRSTGATLFLVPVLGARAGDPSLRALDAALAAHAELVARFPSNARGELDALPLDVGDSSSWARGSWTRALLVGDATVGDVLELWRLDP